ncbi:MAG: low affinity iron permease family protein [Thermomicrobiaceae bacterium]|nr:low affinity iron permease family protein [Thermomicrobiaceae bacterium]
MRAWFEHFASRTSEISGSAWAFILATVVIVVWAMTGPLFGFSDTWQLVINTGTTIVTFLMVFLIQNTQNREAKATQIKLDELIRAVENARNQLIDVEDATGEELEQFKEEFRAEREECVDEESASPATPVSRNGRREPEPR